MKKVSFFFLLLFAIPSICSAALSVKLGQITQKTSTGNQAYTGVGFLPKIVFFWSDKLTGDGSAADSHFGFGAAVSSSDRHEIANGTPSGLSGNEASWYYSDAACIRIVSGASGNALSNADFVSMDSDGFTLNWTIADATARKINYLALAGTDLTNVKTGQFTQKTSTGNQATTGVGFQPDSIILFGSHQTTNTPPAGSFGLVKQKMGYGKSSTKRGVSVNYVSHGGQPGTTKSYQRTSKIFADISTTVLVEVDLVSLDSDGFTLNYTTTTASANYMFYVALKGIQVDVGNFLQETSTGNKSTTGIGFQPSAIIFQTIAQAASSSVQDNARENVGVGVSSSSRFSMFAGAKHNVNPSNSSQNQDTTKVIKMMTESTSSPTTEAAADLVSMDSDGWTLNWTTADATAREIIYFAIGPAAGGGALRRRVHEIV